MYSFAYSDLWPPTPEQKFDKETKRSTKCDISSGADVHEKNGTDTMAAVVTRSEFDKRVAK